MTERPCRLCGAMIRVICDENGRDFAIDAKTVPIPILTENGERVRRYQHFHLAHAQTCALGGGAGIAAPRPVGGSAAPSRTAPSPGIAAPRSGNAAAKSSNGGGK